MEFALSFIVFLLLVLGLFEFGRAVWAYTTVVHAARSGARYAALHGEAQPATDQQIEEVVAANLIGLDGRDIGLVVTWDPDRERGSYVKVRVQYELPLMIGPFFSDNGSLSLATTAGAIVAQ